MRSALAIVLAFGALLLTPPAQANWQSNSVLVQGDTIQFSYVWGWAEREVQGEIFVTVDNTITNKIGYDGEVIDSYRIIFGDQVIEGTEKGVFAYTFTATESQVIRFEGIDNGFWGGYYGPIVTVTQAVQETPLEPVSESATVSPEVTESATVSESASVSEEVIESPITESAPVVEPVVPEPEVLPVEPEIVTPSEPETFEPPEPTGSPTATESSAQEPNQTTESPTTSPVVSESAPIQSSEPAPATTLPENPSIEQPQPTPEQTLEPIDQEVIEPSQPPLEPTTSESVTVDNTDTSSGLVVVGEALADLVGAVTSAGLDMTPEQREEAQEVIVSSVIVSQVAGAATAAVRKK